MKINKKLILSQTITFLCVMIFIIAFKSIFGEENTLVGVTTVTATLMFLQRDLTLNPVKNTFKLIGINLLIGIGAILASSNIYLGIFVNFSVLFIISYIFCYNLRNPMYVAFSLQYLFILVKPVTGNLIWIRLLSLVAGAVIIVLAQVLFNKNKLAKAGNAILNNVCDLIINKIENKDDNMDDVERNRNIHNSMDTFRTMIYDKREYNYYLTEEGRLKLNLSVALENISDMLSGDNITHIEKDILITLTYLIEELREVLNITKSKKENNNLKEKDINFTSDRINELLKICEKNKTSDLLNLQLLDSMILLSDTIDALKKLDVKHFNLVNISHEASDLLSDKDIKSLFTYKKSLRFSYAMRVAITITIAAFIVDYFHITDGRWILFTILSLINPLYEVSKSKTKDRVLSTLIGSVIVFILFSIFKDDTSRMLIVMLSGYINGYFKEYKYNMIFITISAIGSAALVDNIQILTINRILFVVLGAILAILANRYIFPYSVMDSIHHLKNMYHAAVVAMLKEVHNLVTGEKRPTHMKNLMVLTSLIDAKGRADVKLTNIHSYNEVITERRNLVTNIYELYLLILRNGVDCESQKEILSDLKDLIEYSDEDISQKIAHVEHGIKVAHNIDTKIILSSIAVILKELSHLSELNKKVN